MDKLWVGWTRIDGRRWPERRTQMMRGVLCGVVALVVASTVAPQVTAYEIRAFAGKSRKATLDDLLPKYDEAENEKNKFYAEQYSFAFSADGDEEFWFQFLIANMGVANGKGAVRVHFAPPGGKKIKAENAFKREDWSASREKGAMTISMGENRLTGDGSQWQAHFENDHFVADCKITNTAPAWRPGGGALYYGGGKSSYYDVTLLTPRGKFEADVVMAETGKKYHLTGTVYGDNSIINVSPNLQARRWVKTRKIGSKYTIVLTMLETSEQYGGQWVGFFFVASDRGMVATGLNPKVELVGVEKDPKNGYEVPTMVLLSDARGIEGFAGALKAGKRLYRKDLLASLGTIEKALVRKLIQPFGYKYRAEYEFEFLSRKGKRKKLKGKSYYTFEQFTK
jgi:hypothetical protein